MRRFRAPALLAGLVLAALTLWPAGAAADEFPPHAYDRLDRVGAALAEDPLFVDPDVGHALGAADRARVRAAIEKAADRIGTPVYVVVIPNPGDSESQGRNDAFLFGLHDRSGRDGLYLMADSYGFIMDVAFNVPRRQKRYALQDDEQADPTEPADRERRFDDLADRIIRILTDYATSPAASPGMPELYSSPAPFGQEHTLTPDAPEIRTPFLIGLLCAGPVAAAVLYWLGVGVMAVRRPGGPLEKTKIEQQSRVESEPGMRRLRREGARELARLRRLLATTEGGRGRPYAVSAYDAAQILYDDAKEDRNRAIDLVGAIVLARQGILALTRDIPSPPAPCLVNPLHGEAVRHRTLRGMDVPKPCPLCRTCAQLEKLRLLGEQHLLKIPGPDGPRPHTAIPGVWRDTAWGARGKKSLPHVMRYLGVD